MKDSDHTTDFYSTFADQYYSHTKDIGPVGFRAQFCTLLSPGCAILEVGCGHGRDAEYFVESGFSYVGIDYSSELLEKGRQRVPSVEFKQMDARHLEFANESFDAVWCCATICHLDEPDKLLALQEMYRVVKPGGYVWVCDKQGEGSELRVESRYGGAKRYYVYTDEASFRKRLTMAGFTVLEVTGNESLQSEYCIGTSWINMTAQKPVQ